MANYREEHASMPGSISRPNFYETRRIGYGIKAVAFLHRAISSPAPFHRQFLQISTLCRLEAKKISNFLLHEWPLFLVIPSERQ